MACSLNYLHMSKVFEIRVTDTDDQNDFATMEYLSQEEDASADYVMERIGNAVNYQKELEFHHGDKFVVIFPCSDDEGYMYSIYKSRAAFEADEDSIDGGQCTGTINDAIEMALN